MSWAGGCQDSLEILIDKQKIIFSGPAASTSNPLYDAAASS